MCDVLYLRHIISNEASVSSMYCLTRCCFINEFMSEYHFPFLAEDVSHICGSNSYCQIGYDCHKFGIESMVKYINSKNIMFRLYCG